LIVAGLAAVLVALAADRDTHPAHKKGPVGHAGPCTPPGPNRVALPAPVGGPVSAPHGPVLVLVPDLAHPGLAPVVLGA
jgi:hypothetical protein